MTINFLQNSLQELSLAIEDFKKNNEVQAFQHFDQFCEMSSSLEILKDAKGKIYGKIWKIDGEPHPHSTHVDYGRAAFYNLEGRSTSNSNKAKALIFCFKRIIKKELKRMADECRAGNADIEQKNFEILFQLANKSLLFKKIRNLVYQKMWKIAGAIGSANSDAGRFIFHNLHGLSSSNIKKAEALEACIRELNHRKFSTYTKLNKKALSYYRRKGPFIPVDTSAVNFSSFNDLMDKLFDQNPGIPFGETHSKERSKELIIQYLDYFKSKGVTILFVEQLYDHMQDDLDIFNNGGSFSQEIEDNLNDAERHGFVYPNSYRGLFDKTREKGIRIVALDTEWANIYPDTATTQHARWQTMNYAAAKIIKHEKGNGKFIALMGNNHLANHTQSMPGVCEMIHCPSITISNLELPSIIKNHRSSQNFDDIEMVVNFAI